MHTRKCSNCNYKYDEDGGHCYMFETKPTSDNACAQHKFDNEIQKPNPMGILLGTNGVFDGD
jgi:rubredoxin